MLFASNCLVLLSSSLAEMRKWMEDIRVAIDVAKTTNGLSSDLLTCSLTGNSTFDNRYRLSLSLYSSFLKWKMNRK